MRAPLLLDTGGWLLALAGEPAYADALKEAAPAIVPGLVLAEVDYHLRRRRSAAHRLFRELEAGAYSYEPATLDDLARAREIDRKFANLELGLVDASIAALAERLDTFRLLTIDSDFVPLRVGPRWNVAFELVVHPS